jgi:gamma-glutamylaminecyclotransferase
VGERQSPWLIDDPGAGLPVTGEVYGLDPEGLARMDRLERVEAADGYRRRRIELLEVESGRWIRAEAYLKPLDQFLALPDYEPRSGPFSEYGPELAAGYRSRPVDPATE